MAEQSQRGCAELISGNRLPIKNSLVLLGVLCFTLMACGGPDYTKAGHTGEKPPKDILTGYSISVITPLPSPMACDQAYKITAKVKESVNKCEGYNFTKLFDLAKSLVEKQVKALSPTCPKDCSTLQEINSAMGWSCVKVGDASFANLSLQVSLICPKPDAKVPEDHKPTAEELAKDFRFDPAYDLDKEPDAEVTQILYSSLPCPKKELIQVYYKEFLPNFAKVISATDCSSLAKTDIYKAYAQKGEDLAKEYFDTLTCPAGCEKVPFDKVSYQEWGCDPADKTVVVRTFFYVECKKSHRITHRGGIRGSVL